MLSFVMAEGGNYLENRMDTIVVIINGDYSLPN